MKLELSISAADVDASSFTVSHEVEISTTDGSEVIVFDYDPESSPSNLDIAVGSIGTVTFDIAELLEDPDHTKAKPLEGGGTIAVYLQEHKVMGTLKLKLRGHKLKNIEEGIGLNKSDPYFELAGAEGDAVFRSKVMRNHLNPKWPAFEVDVHALCGCDLNKYISMTVWDHDVVTAADLMGSLSFTVNELLNKDKDVGMAMSKGAESDVGTVFVDSAELVVNKSVTNKATAAMEAAAANLLANTKIFGSAKEAAEQKAKAAKLAQERADAAAALAEEKETAAQAAAEETAEAKKTSDELEAIAEKASDNAKKQPCAGIFILLLRGEKLEDTDGMFDKTDPFYEVYGYNGERVYKSEIVKDDLNPSWTKAKIDACKLTGGNLDVPIRITINDKDEGKKVGYMGQIHMSVNELLQAKETEHVKFVKGGKSAEGHIIVQRAELEDFHDYKQDAKQTKDTADDARMEYYGKSRASKKLEKEAASVRAAASKQKETAEFLASAAEAAKQAAEEAAASLEG